jgi:hypothetical protein
MQRVTGEYRDSLIAGFQREALHFEMRDVDKSCRFIVGEDAQNVKTCIRTLQLRRHAAYRRPNAPSLSGRAMSEPCRCRCLRPRVLRDAPEQAKSSQAHGQPPP